MELDDIKTQLEHLDGKLDAAVRLNRRVLDVRILDKADRALKWLGWGLGIELALGVVAVLLTGSFVGDHVREPRFLVPGLVLHLFVIAQIAMLVRHTVATRQIDFGAPIVEIQRRVETLRVSMIRTTMWTFLLAPLLWPPLLIVGLEGVLGIDAYAALGAPYLAANVAVGLMVIAIGLLVSRLYADRLSGSPFVRRLMRDLAGSNLAAAQGFLDSLSRFERDDPGAH
jgi:hypothetical protein